MHNDGSTHNTDSMLSTSSMHSTDSMHSKGSTHSTQRPLKLPIILDDLLPGKFAF